MANLRFCYIKYFNNTCLENSSIRNYFRLERPAHCHPDLYLIIQVSTQLGLDFAWLFSFIICFQFALIIFLLNLIMAMIRNARQAGILSVFCFNQIAIIITMITMMIRNAGRGIWTRGRTSVSCGRRLPNCLKISMGNIFNVTLMRTFLNLLK